MEQTRTYNQTATLERWSWLKRIARGMLGSETEAEDLASEVMAYLLSGPDVLDGVEKVEAWLYTLVRRRAVDSIRGKQRRRRLDSSAAPPEADPARGADALLEEEQLEDAFSQAVKSLPPELAEVFIANALEKETFREISARTGVPPGTLMARKQRAVALLRQKLEEMGYRP